MTEQRASLTEEYIGYPGCTCAPDVNIWGDDICAVCKEVRDDEAAQDALITYCKVCDGGHDGGEFGELCPANGPRWFEPSDPRDLNDQFELSASGNQRTPEDWF
jgi:hypothetical protein